MVCGDDEFQFANAEPALEDFLAVNGCGDRGEAFEIDELGDVVFGCAAVRILLLLVLTNSDLEIGGDADVKLLEAVGKNIDVGVFGHLRLGQSKGKNKG